MLFTNSGEEARACPFSSKDFVKEPTDFVTLESHRNSLASQFSAEPDIHGSQLWDLK